MRFILLLPLSFFASLAFAEFTASVGVQSAELQVTSETELLDLQYDASSSNRDTDVSGEVALGYRYQINDLFAADLDLFTQFINAETKVPTIAGNDSWGIPDATASFEWLWGVRLRPGYQFTDAARFFVSIGVAWANLEIEYTDEIVALTGLDGNEDSAVFGFSYGAGLEYALNDFCLLSLDYALTPFDSLSGDTISHLGSIDLSNHGNETDYTPTLSTIGLNFKVLFGDDWF